MALAGVGIACRPEEGTAMRVISSQSASMGARRVLPSDHGSGGRGITYSAVSDV